jgi:hypothetical protein
MSHVTHMYILVMLQLSILGEAHFEASITQAHHSKSRRSHYHLCYSYINYESLRFSFATRVLGRSRHYSKKGNSLWGYQRSFSHEPRPASELQAQCAAHPIRSDAHENSNSQFKNKTKQNKANQPTIQSTIKAAVQGTTHPICSPHRSSTLATTQRVSRQKLTLAGRSTDKTLKPGRAKGSRWGVMRKGTVQP